MHDKDGNMVAEIVPDFARYGVTEKTSYLEYVHIPFVRDNGEIYVLVRVEKGLFVVRYSPAY